MKGDQGGEADRHCSQTRKADVPIEMVARVIRAWMSAMRRVPRGRRRRIMPKEVLDQRLARMRREEEADATISISVMLSGETWLGGRP